MDKNDLTQNELNMVNWIENQLDIDRHRLQQRYPFFGNFLMRLETSVGHWEDIPTACTNGKTIYVDALFYSKLTEDERLFVLAHETAHCFMLHFLRAQNRDKDLWNIATDLEIHFMLKKEKMTPPFVLPHEGSWNGLSAEEIYEILKKRQNLKPQQDSSGGSDETEGDSPSFSKGLKESGNMSSGGLTKGGLTKGFDELIYGGKNPDDNKRFDPDEVQNEIISKIKSTMEAVKTRGTIPGNIHAIVNKFSKREIDWRTLLTQFMTSCYSGNRSWLPPNKRYIYRGLYLPSMHDVRLNAVVAIDTSASCIDFLPKFFSELSGLLNSFGKYDLTVIQADYDIQHVDHYDENTPIPKDGKWGSYGYGGTSFTPVFEHVKNNLETKPSCLIYFTDGYGDAPKNPPDFPVLWMVTPDGSEDFCKWGMKTRFRKV